MTLGPELIPWGVSMFTLLGLAFGFGARLAKIEERTDLLYDIYVKEKLRKVEHREMATHSSPWRLTEKGVNLLRPDIIEAVCQTVPTTAEIRTVFQYVARHPHLATMIEDQAQEIDVGWGELVTAYALYVTNYLCATNKALSWWQRLWRWIWP